MFSQLYRRLTGLIVSAVILAVIITGTVCTINTVTACQNNFKNSMTEWYLERPDRL